MRLVLYRHVIINLMPSRALISCEIKSKYLIISPELFKYHLKEANLGTITSGREKRKLNVCKADFLSWQRTSFKTGPAVASVSSTTGLLFTFAKLEYGLNFFITPFEDCLRYFRFKI